MVRKTLKSWVGSFVWAGLVLGVTQVSIPSVLAESAAPRFYEDYASAWERYSRATVEEEEARRAQNTRRAEEASARADAAAQEAERRRGEATTALQARQREISERTAELERQRTALTALERTYEERRAAASNDRLRGRRTDATRAEVAATRDWREASRQMEPIDRELRRLEEEGTRLQAQIAREQGVATTAQARITAAAETVSQNAPLDEQQRAALRLQAARDFFNDMRQQGYDARFLLMDTRNLQGDVEALKTVLDTQLNDTLMGGYVNSQIGKMGQNFCSLAESCAGDSAASVPSRIQSLLQGSREQARARTSDRSVPSAEGEPLAAPSSSGATGENPQAVKAQ